jgi:hypothetical protein
MALAINCFQVSRAGRGRLGSRCRRYGSTHAGSSDGSVLQRLPRLAGEGGRDKSDGEREQWHAKCHGSLPTTPGRGRVATAVGKSV